MDNYILEVSNLAMKQHRFQLKDISFRLEPGFIYAIAGENGSGKTSLLKALINEKGLKTGVITFDGFNPKTNHNKAMNEIGFVSEDNVFFGDRSGNQIAEMYSTLYENFDLDLFREKMDQMQVPKSTSYRRLSRGEKMKFQVALALAHHVKLLILDEATAGMDPVFRIEFFDLLRGFLLDGGTVLMTSHNMAEIAKQTDYVAFMADGKLGAFQESMEVK